LNDLDQSTMTLIWCENMSSATMKNCKSKQSVRGVMQRYKYFQKLELSEYCIPKIMNNGCGFFWLLCPTPIGWGIKHWRPSSVCLFICLVPDPKSRTA